MGGSISSTAEQPPSNDHSTINSGVFVSRSTSHQGSENAAIDIADEDESTDGHSASNISEFSVPPTQKLPIQRLSSPSVNEEESRGRFYKNTRDVGVETEGKTSGGEDEPKSRSLLWSNSSNSNNSSRLSLSRSFNSRSNVGSLTRGLKSPYYEGRTTFGGTSAKRARMAPSVLTISPTSSNTIKPKINDLSETGKNKLKSSEDLTDAAKRILATIESVSSPLEDAKKIPLYGQVDHNKYLINPKRSVTHQPYSRPPKPSTPFSSNLHSLKPLEKQLKWSSTSTDTTVTGGHSHVSHDKSNSSSSNIGDKYTSPEWVKTCSQRITSETGGKIRGRVSIRARRDGLEERVPPVNLPNVPLNITSLPKFNFDPQNFKVKQSECSLTSDSKSCDADVENARTNRKAYFAAISQSNDVNHPSQFSKKHGLVSKPTTTIEVVRNEVAIDSEFSFSQPTPKKEFDSKKRFFKVIVDDAEERKDKNKVEVESSGESKIVPKTDPFSVSQKILRTKNRINADAALEAVEFKEYTTRNSDKTRSIDNSAETVEELTDVAKSISTSIISDSSAASDSFKASSKNDIAADDKAGENLFEKFKPPSDSWTCDTCLLPNESSKTKCVACETPKESSLTAQSSAPKFQFGLAAPTSLQPQSSIFQIEKPPASTSAPVASDPAVSSPSVSLFNIKPSTSNMPSTTLSSLSQRPQGSSLGFQFDVSKSTSLSTSSMSSIATSTKSFFASSQAATTSDSLPSQNGFNFPTRHQSFDSKPTTTAASIAPTEPPSFNKVFGDPVSTSQVSPSVTSNSAIVASPSTNVTYNSSPFSSVFNSVNSAVTTTAPTFNFNDNSFSSNKLQAKTLTPEPPKAPSVLPLSSSLKFQFPSSGSSSSLQQSSSFPLDKTSSLGSTSNITSSTIHQPITSLPSGFTFSLKPGGSSMPSTVSSLSLRPQSSTTGFSGYNTKSSPLTSSPASSAAPTTQGFTFAPKSLPSTTSDTLTSPNGFFPNRLQSFDSKPASTTSASSTSSAPTFNAFNKPSSNLALTKPATSSFNFASTCTTSTPSFGSGPPMPPTSTATQYSGGCFSSSSSVSGSSILSQSTTPTPSPFSFTGQTATPAQPNGGSASAPSMPSFSAQPNFNFGQQASNQTFRFTAEPTASSHRVIKKARRRMTPNMNNN